MRGTADARVVHGEVQGAEGVHGEPHTGLDGGGVGDVEDDGGRAGTGGPDFVGGLVRAALVVVGDHDGRTARGEPPGEGEADA